MRICILGNKGGMGQWFTRFFEEKGCSVFGYEKAQWEHLATVDAEVIMVCVPLQESVQLLRLLSPKVRPHQLVCDVSSLKTQQMQALDSCKGDILGIHPMFGPTMLSERGQVVLHTAAKSSLARQVLLWFKDAELQEVTAQEHDELMAVVQGFTHMLTLTFGEMLRRHRLSPSDALKFRTPTFHVLMSLAGRLVGQDPALYAPIIYDNPAMQTILQDYSELTQELASMDRASFVRAFTHLRTHFKEYSPQAAAETERAFLCYASPEKMAYPIIARQLTPAAQGEKGSTYEWCKNQPGLQVTYYTRKKGTLFACHAHTGKDISKNPERFLLLTGKVRIDWRTKDAMGTLEVKEVSEVLIAPDVYHEFYALEDSSFLEYRRTAYDPKEPDGLSKEDYDLYMDTKS